ncbi:MAG: hypothetical protein J6W29_04240 [Neisseriaceae bacterium]|nr:hypothetical protein [Neisseriaceae bacterium]MBR7001314.1 hypothetical protein [Neisseriaceae bacterium]
MQKRYQVKFQRTDSNSGVNTTNVSANSASEAKEKVKAWHNGKVRIISCVEE